MAMSRRRYPGAQSPTASSVRQVLLNSAANGSKVQPMDCTSVPEEEQELSEITVHQWCRHIEDILNRTHKELFSRLDAWMLESFAPGRGAFLDELRPATSNGHSGRPSSSSHAPSERRHSHVEISSTDDPIARLMLAENSERSRPAMPTMIPGKSKVLDDEEHEKVALEKSKIRKEWTERQGSKVLENSFEVDKNFGGKISRELERIVDSSRFEAVFSVALLSNALFIGITLQLAADRYGVMADASSALEEGPVVTAIHGIYAVVFLIELLMRMGAQGQSFFSSYDRANLFWNYLDAVLVGVSIVESILVLVLVEDTEIGMSNKLRTMRIVRLTRLVRLLRAIRFFAGLRTLIYSIFYTLKALAWSIILLLLMMYVLGILLTDATLAHVITYENSTMIPHDSNDGVLYSHFGTLHLSMHTLFRSITGGVDWSSLAVALAPLNWIWVYLFSAYIAFCLFAVLNVMTGVFCQRATELAEKDHDAQLLGLQMENERVRMECRNLFRRFDVAKQGSLTLLEFELMFQRDDIKASLQVLDIEVSEADAWRFFRLLDTDGDGDVREQDFTEGVLHLRGPARTIDVACEAEDNRRMKAKLGQMEAQDRRTASVLRSLTLQLTHIGQSIEDLRSEGWSKPPEGRDAQESSQGDAEPEQPSGKQHASGPEAATFERTCDEPCTIPRETEKEPTSPGLRPTVPQPPQSPSLRLLASPASPIGAPVFLLDSTADTLQAASNRVQQQIEKERIMKWDFDLHYDVDPRMACGSPTSPTRGTVTVDFSSRACPRS